MLTVRRLARVVSEFATPIRVGLVVAGWDVAHAHVHVIPMHEYHDITSKSLLDGTLARADEQDLAAIAAAMRRLLTPDSGA